MPSSTSIPSSPLPFAADTHTHGSWRHSHPRLNNHHQSYASFLAAAQAKNTVVPGADAASHITTPSIAPSSVSSLPYSHRKLLRRHGRLLYGLLASFYVSSILLTIAIVLIVRNATLVGNRELRASGVIMGVIGFAGVAASLTGTWGVWKARKERAKMEKEWVVEEREKDERQKREKKKEKMKTKAIKERERSLSATRSVSRGRRRVEKDNATTSTSNRRTEIERPFTKGSRQQPKDKSKSTSTKRAELEGYLARGAQEDEIIPASFNLQSHNLALPTPTFARGRSAISPRTTSLDRYVASKTQKPNTDSHDSMPWTHHLDLDTDDEGKNADPQFPKATKGKDRRSKSASGLKIPITQTETSVKSAKPESEKGVKKSSQKGKAPINQAPTPANQPPTISSTLTPTSPFPSFYPMPAQPAATIPRIHTPRSTRHRSPPPPAQSLTGSDANFLAMISLASDAASEDEEVREARRTRSMERVRKWRDYQTSLSDGEARAPTEDDEDEDEGRRGRARKGWRGKMRRGLGRIVGVDMERDL